MADISFNRFVVIVWRPRMKRPTSKETEYVDKLLAKRKSMNARLMGEDVSALKAASICGYQEGIDYAIRTLFNIYLGDEE